MRTLLNTTLLLTIFGSALAITDSHSDAFPLQPALGAPATEADTTDPRHSHRTGDHSGAGVESDFDKLWWNPRSEEKLGAQYLNRLDRYIASNRLKVSRCHKNLSGKQAARVLLMFDEHGGFQVRTQSKNKRLISCLTEAFLAQPPPKPDAVPLTLRYEFEHASASP